MWLFCKAPSRTSSYKLVINIQLICWKIDFEATSLPLTYRMRHERLRVCVSVCLSHVCLYVMI